MNTVVIDIDSLRPDHLGCYGYPLDTSPAIDAVADDGTVFDRAYAANTPSLPARASIVTGRYGISNGVETHGPAAYQVSSPHTWDTVDRHRRSHWTLPELFFQERVRTGAVAPDTRHPAPWFTHVWHELLQPQEPRGEQESFMTVRGDAVVDEAQGFLDRNGSDGFFLYTQFWEPHPPYRVPDQYGVETGEVPLPPHPTADAIDRYTTPDRWCTDVAVETREDLRELLAAYDATVQAVDAYVGRLVDQLKQAGMYDDTLIVVTADHGEAFGEHGVYREHWSTYEPTQRVPFIVKPPAGVDGPDRCNELVTHVDLAPTLADVAGLEPPRAWQGRSVAPLLRGEQAGWRYAVVLDHGLYTAQRAVRTDRWKLVRTFHPGVWEDRLPPVQLFDMETDPWEQDDVSGENADVVMELQQRMRAFEDAHVGRGGDPLQRVAENGPVGSTVYGQ
ncbi:MAG: sulfatase [Candidatus Nanohaloarchaea archaeon]|nr:sulfatase [Candidatus Nanohaloarchaea archaeon]